MFGPMRFMKQAKTKWLRIILKSGYPITLLITILAAIAGGISVYQN